MPRLTKLRRIAAQRLPIATKDQMRAAAAVGREWAGAYERLLAATQSRPVGSPPRKVPVPDPAIAVRAATTKGLPTPFVDEIRRGATLTDATLETVRTLVKQKRIAAAQSFAASLAAQPTTAVVGSLANGVLAESRGFHPLALHSFDLSDRELVLAHAPDELVRALFAVDRDRGVAEARTWLADPGTPFGAKTWFEVYKHLFVADELRLADSAHARMTTAFEADPKAWPMGRTELTWLTKWEKAERNVTAPPSPAGHVTFGLVDYVQPGRARASQNIGDQVQTLASLGHVVRHQDLRFHADDDLLGFVHEMRDRVRPELRLSGVSADIDLLTVDRDSSTYQAFPENTWLLEFGWHMHGLFGLDVFDFPLHPNLNPIFVSFHCNNRGLLTPETIEYLKAHGPIGCRDWTTVDLLLSLDVPAFFSGCLTTTVNTVFPDLGTTPAPASIYVDVMRTPVPAGHENVRQSYPEVKKKTFVENMYDAVALLERYRTGYTKVVTTRLHSYLPSRSIGLEVQFDPKNNADVRFAGLFRLDQKDFDAIRTRMRDRLQPVLTAIFEGASRDDVYALWRAEVADEVRAARARHESAEPLAPHGAPARELVAHLGTDPADVSGDAVDVVLLPTSKNISHVGTILRSVAAHSSRPVRAWLVTRAAERPELTIDGVKVRWIDTSALSSSDAGLLSDQDLDTVLLPELLPVSRAVVLPVEAVVVADIATLLATDLGEATLAARSTSQASTSGFGVLYGAARRLDQAPDTAYDFYRRIHARHVFDFDAFDTDVMVLDLARLRDERFSDELLPAMRTFQLTARDALHFFAGPHRVDLDPAWAFVATREHVATPFIWHWADSTKPWSKDYTPGREIWSRHHVAS